MLSVTEVIACREIGIETFYFLTIVHNDQGYFNKNSYMDENNFKIFSLKEFHQPWPQPATSKARTLTHTLPRLQG